jgi:hypothetical protein
MGENEKRDFSSTVRQVGPQKVVQAMEKITQGTVLDFPDEALEQVTSSNQEPSPNGDHPKEDKPTDPEPKKKEPCNPAPLVERYGPFAFRGKEGQLSGISQAFWAGLFADENIVLHEPAEGQFYLYQKHSGLYIATTEAKIRSTIADRIWKAAIEWDNPELARFRTARDLSACGEGAAKANVGEATDRR